MCQKSCFVYRPTAHSPGSSGPYRVSLRRLAAHLSLWSHPKLDRNFPRLLQIPLILGTIVNPIAKHDTRTYLIVATDNDLGWAPYIGDRAIEMRAVYLLTSCIVGCVNPHFVQV